MAAILRLHPVVEASRPSATRVPSESARTAA
jgi:hypothetical protein